MNKPLFIIGALVVLFFVFGLGALVGYRKALFSSEWGLNYYRNFYGNPHLGIFAQTLGRMPLDGHGVAGEVLAVSTSTIVVTGEDGNEASVVVFSGTVIRDQNAAISITDVRAGDQLTAIGEPNGEGQMQAKFIRIFDASSSMPLMPGVNFN